ncbi:MAG: hypothetical protein SRB1_03125 [Desulfobacteraceae bacterium Eth-SRB1]|nr:MAG: hypothetical protein SRB1_03125 [Desulfobacteraceae bacterium Eth-SRB1]
MFAILDPKTVGLRSVQLRGIDRAESLMCWGECGQLRGSFTSWNIKCNIEEFLIFLLSAVQRSYFIAITRIAPSLSISCICSDKTYRALV